MLTARIDVTKIDKARLFKGKMKDGKCPMYLDIAIIETKQSQYGDWRDDQTHMVVQSVTQEERKAGVKGPILGNACDRDKRRTNDKPPAAKAEDHLPSVPGDEDDVPF